MELKNSSWQSLLSKEFEKPYFQNLMQHVANEYDTHKCFPPKEQIFAAFDHFDYQDTKVVILGQDPYHGQGEAHGLSFSVPDGVKLPPSLKNIFTEINNEFDAVLYPPSGNLTRWAKQGVLLLNATLSVRKDQPNSHKHLQWQTFTDAVIAAISEQTTHTVFMLWGGFAQKKKTHIAAASHFILESGHPSPLSANRGLWFGNQHFKQANDYLVTHGKQAIEWV